MIKLAVTVTIFVILFYKLMKMINEEKIKPILDFNAKEVVTVIKVEFPTLYDSETSEIISKNDLKGKTVYYSQIDNENINWYISDPKVPFKDVKSGEMIVYKGNNGKYYLCTKKDNTVYFGDLIINLSKHNYEGTIKPLKKKGNCLWM